MKRLIAALTFHLAVYTIYCQGLVNIGDNVPAYNFTKLVNAPYNQIALTELKGKPIVLAFWGT